MCERSHKYFLHNCVYLFFCYYWSRYIDILIESSKKKKTVAFQQTLVHQKTSDKTCDNDESKLMNFRNALCVYTKYDLDAFGVLNLCVKKHVYMLREQKKEGF